MEELFRKKVAVTLKRADKEDSLAHATLCVHMNTVASPVHRKELLIRMTDDRDPFFLYTLSIGDDDFTQLKAQQGLLVDFSSFPQKFIDLINTCLYESEQPAPKFLLQLVLSSDKSPSLLHVIETNPFRHLNHLTLRLVPASESHLKKYLAECLMGLKEENATLIDTLSATKSDLSAQLAHTESVLAGKTKELDKLRSDWSAHTTNLLTEHSATLSAEKEKALQIQAEGERRLAQERRDIEHAYSAKVLSLEERQKALDLSNKELTDHKYRSEAAIRELKTKLAITEEELSTARQDLSAVRRDNAAFDSAHHEQEKVTNQMRTRLAVVEQELHDKQQMIERTSQLLEAAREQKLSAEAMAEHSNRQVTKLDTAFREASHEVAKGNDIIQKLQSELRNLKSKIKMKNLVTTQQEKLLNDKGVELEKLKVELSSLKERLTSKEEELGRAEENTEALRRKLEETADMLRTNENVISWLNKQMNDRVMSGRTELPSSIRYPPPLSSYSGVHRPQYSSTPTTLPPSARHPAAPGRAVLNSLASKENITQVVFRGPSKWVPSPLAAHNHSAPTISEESPPTVPAPRSKSNPSSPGDVPGPVLDPRYLPPRSSPPEHCTPARHPPLASTYFPK